MILSISNKLLTLHNPFSQNTGDIKISDLEQDDGFDTKSLSRGVAGLPISETPALIGAKRGHIQCDVNVDSLAYWNAPQGTSDTEFHSPFAVKVRLPGIGGILSLASPLRFCWADDLRL